MEIMVSLAALSPYYRGKKVFLTGHTGFKGAWLLQILSRMGAVVKGFALAPEHPGDLYHLIDGDGLCHASVLHDIRDADRLRKEILHFEPDYIFHLAAQPLVLKGYAEPLYTFEVNTQGTANVLDALRYVEKDCVAVMITTDKVYENLEDGRPFVESDKLGGHDPYSASKAACEVIISSYRSSFFAPGLSSWNKPVAAVRAGNVIGGGDFSDNRIIPDIVKALREERSILLRNPDSTRPWQHVLEPLATYLLLGARMTESPEKYSTAFNIGPEEGDVLTVEALTQLAISVAGKGSYEVKRNPNQPHEAAALALNIEKIKKELGWTPVYSSAKAIEKTIAWYMDSAHADVKCQVQINDYFQAAIQDAQEDRPHARN